MRKHLPRRNDCTVHTPIHKGMGQKGHIRRLKFSTGLTPLACESSESIRDIGFLYTRPASLFSVKRAEVIGRKFTVVLRQEDVGGYSVRCVEIPAAISQGETRSEALKNIREAIELYLETFPEELKIIEELGRVTGRKEVVEVTV